MTRTIGDVPISSVQDISINFFKEFDEIDQVDKNVNMVLLGEESLKEVSIDFTLNSQSSPSGKSIEEQKEEIRKIVQRKETENSFVLDGQPGYIAAENVSIPETSQEVNIITGSLEGKFLPWPKHFPQNRPTIVLILQGRIETRFLLSGDASLELAIGGDIENNSNIDGDIVRSRSVKGTIQNNSNIDGDIIIWKLLNSAFSGKFILGAGDEYSSDEYTNDSYGITQPILSLVNAMIGEISGTLKVKDNFYAQNYGSLYGSPDPLLSVYIFLESFTDGRLKSTGDLRDFNEIEYGNDYGYDYGGLIFDYGAGIYDKEIYGE